MRPIPASDNALLGLELEEHEHTSDDSRYRIHSLPRNIEQKLRNPMEEQ